MQYVICMNIWTHPTLGLYGGPVLQCPILLTIPYLFNKLVLQSFIFLDEKEAGKNLIWLEAKLGRPNRWEACHRLVLRCRPQSQDLSHMSTGNKKNTMACSQRLPGQDGQVDKRMFCAWSTPHAIPRHPTPIRAFGSGSLGRNLSWETLPNLGRWDPFIAKLLFHACGHWSLRFHTHCSILPTQKLPCPSKHETWKHANTCKLTPKNYMTKWPNHPNPIFVFPMASGFSGSSAVVVACLELPSGYLVGLCHAETPTTNMHHLIIVQTYSDIFRHIHPTSKISKQFEQINPWKHPSPQCLNRLRSGLTTGIRSRHVNLRLLWLFASWRFLRIMSWMIHNDSWRFINIKVAPNTPNTRRGTWLIKWLNDQFPSLVAVIYIQWIGAIMNIHKDQMMPCHV